MRALTNLKFIVLTALLSSVVPAAQAQESGRAGFALRLLAHAAAGSLDPQTNATGQFWQLYAFTYDGLLATRKADGAAGQEVVPDLAESMPTILDGGKQYVFRLRTGVRFSNGVMLDPEDVPASFRRMFQVAGPTAGSFFSGIVGADACLRHPADCALPGITADTATRTITIRLTAPDPEFPIKLTLPPASILPKTVPPHDAGITPLPGTGAYRFTGYDPGSAVRIARNPFFRVWNAAAQPEGGPDMIEEAFGLEDEAALTQIENGQADWMFDPPPSDRLPELSTRYAAMVHLNPAMMVWYLAPNSRLPPFDDVRVRQALNFAIDRDALVKLAGGPHMARPTCQMLPPGMPGYVRYCPYPHDLARARALIAASGKVGQRVTLVISNGPQARSIGLYVQSVLKDLGFDAVLRPLSYDIEFTYIQNSANRVQLALTDWAADYPAPSDFLHVLFACDQFHPNTDASLNIGAFCDPALDRRMASALADPDQNHALPIWQAVDRGLMDKAAAVPLFVPMYLNVVSARLGNFMFNDQYHWLLSQARLAGPDARR